MIDLNNIELLNICIQGVKEKLRRFTPQLYLFNNDFPKAYASSILVKVKNQSFLVTAAHVLEGTRPGEIKIGFKHEFIAPLNDWYYLINDKLDLAIMEISGDLKEAISKNYDFYDLGSIYPDHQIKLDQIFFTFGFPVTKTKIVKKARKAKVEALAYSTNLQNASLCHEMGFHPNMHLLLELNKKVKSSLTGNIIKSPDQPGMSGSGIWQILSSYINPSIENIPLILSGIYIEFYKKKNSIVATRTPILTEFLRKKFNCDLLPTKIVIIGT